MTTAVVAVLLALTAGALWRSPRDGDSAARVRWVTLLALLASAAAWGLALYAAHLPNGASTAAPAGMGVVERVLAVREGADPVAWAYAGGDLVRVGLPDWRVLSRVPAQDLSFQTAAYDGRALLVTFVDPRRGRAMVEGWGLLGEGSREARWIVPPTPASTRYGSLSAFWDPADRRLYLAELGEYVDRGGTIVRPLTIFAVDDAGERTPVPVPPGSGTTYVRALESRACRSGGALWLTSDAAQPQTACRVSDASPEGTNGVRSCERASDAPPGGLVCASVLSNLVPGAVLAPNGRAAIRRPPASLVPDAGVALRASLRLLPGGGTLPDYTWWSPTATGSDVVHTAGDGWLRFSTARTAGSARGEAESLLARSLDASGEKVLGEGAVFGMAQLPAYVFVMGDEALAVGITPLTARFRVPGMQRVDRPEAIPRARSRLAAWGGSSRLVEGAMVVLLGAPPFLLLGLAAAGVRALRSLAKRIALLVLVAAPVLVELGQRMWPLR
jgi:hypothetical protein